MVLALVLFAAGLLAQQFPGAPIAPAPQPPPIQTTVHNEVTVQIPQPDPQATADMAAWSFEGIVVNVIAPTVVKWANDMLDQPDFVRHTPPGMTYDNPGVKLMADVVRGAALALFGLMLLAWALGRMLGQYTTIERPFAAAAMAAFNMIAWHVGIDGLNALNDTIAAPDLRSIIGPHLSVPKIAGDPAEAFGPALLGLAYAVTVLLLVVTQFFRLGFVDVLMVLGPLGFICKGTDQSSHFYERYVSLSTGTLFSQVLVVVCLRLAPILGVVGGTVTGGLLGIVVLLLARKMPGMLASQQGGGRGILSLLVLRRALMRF